MRQQRDVLTDWADSLSDKLGHPVESIRARGLSATDFSGSKRVKITFIDGSMAEFRFAFACIRKEQAQVAIFTEHCGYLEFWLVAGMEVVEITEDYYCHE